MTRRRSIVITSGVAATITVAGVLAASIGSASASAPSDGDHSRRPVAVEVAAPSNHDVAGIGGASWIVDLRVDYPGGPTGLRQAGFTAPQLTGPAGHNNIPPLPGTFSTGKDDRLPGLVVLVSTTNSTTPGFSGPGTNLANLFNLTSTTNRTAHDTQIWDTWIVGAPIFGTDIDTTLTVAVVDDLDGNGVFDDAPNIVSDLNHDGRVDKDDLKALGVASNIETVRFHINGAGL